MSEKAFVLDFPAAETGVAGLRNPRRTRARILRAAMELFAAKGPDAAGVDEIATAAGVNKRMLYHYFGSKQGLYLAVLASIYGRIRLIATEVFVEAEDIRALINSIVREYFRFLQQNPKFVSLLNWENSRGATGLSQIGLDSFTEPLIDTAKLALRREKKNRSIRSDVDIKFLIMSCLALCSYYFTNRHSLSVLFDVDMNDPDMMEGWVDHISRLVLDGVAAELSEEDSSS